MARKCFMCGGEVSGGILCEKCDPPKRARAEKKAALQDSQPVAPPAPSPAAPVQPTPPPVPVALETSDALALDPFPKAPVVPFRADAVTPAITSVVDLLAASGVPALLVGPDRSVKFANDPVVELFGASHADINRLPWIEQVTGLRIGDLSEPTSAGIKINGRNVLYTLVPMAGGGSGAVLVFRYADASRQAQASFLEYLQETVFGPLRALRDSLIAASSTRTADPLLEDAASTLDQILSSLELAPGVEESPGGPRPVPTVADVVKKVAKRFTAFADLKGIQLEVDAQELSETLHDHDDLAESLSLLMDNAFHYVPAGGQVVIGVRSMEHKGKPLLLFFVMDNGPLVPESLRTAIFEPNFVWNPASPERTGRSLSRCRDFAVAHAGSVWVESKTGKACSFFLRVRPDGVR